MKTHRQLKIIVAAIIALAVCLFFAPSILRGRVWRSKDAQCLHHARTIALACRLYANDHAGKYPVQLDELIPDYLRDRSIFICPLSSDTIAIGYKYFGGTDTDPADKILLQSKITDERHGRIIVYSDMSGAIVREP